MEFAIFELSLAILFTLNTYKHGKYALNTSHKASVSISSFSSCSIDSEHEQGRI